MDSYRNSCVSTRHGTIVEGGALKHPWAIPLMSIQEVDGTQFYVASKCDRMMRKFLGIGETNTLGVLDAIASCRQQAVDTWCATRLLEDDPLANVAQQRSPSKEEMKMLKRAMPASMLVRVHASGGCPSPSMRVLTCTSANTKVAFEISQENLNWLYDAVQVGDYTEASRQSSQSRAKLGEDLADSYKNVHWRASRKTLWTTYRQNGKTRTLSKRVSSCSDEDRATRKLEREAAKLQGLRDSMHEDSLRTRPSPEDSLRKRCKNSIGRPSPADACIVDVHGMQPEEGSGASVS